MIPRTTTLLMGLTLVVACGEVAGDAIVRQDETTRVAGGAGGTDPGPGAGAAPRGGARSGAGGAAGRAPFDPVEVCAECVGQGDCVNGACIENDATGEKFCVPQCTRETQCPDRFTCVRINNVAASHCVPITGSCQNLDGEPRGGGCPEPSVYRQYVRAELNRLRAAENRPAYASDACLDDIAQEGSAEVASGAPVQSKFRRECLGQASCECNWRQENQSIRIRSGIYWSGNVDDAIAGMVEDPGSGSWENVYSNLWTRLGVGVACSQNGEAIVLTLDFGP